MENSDNGGQPGLFQRAALWTVFSLSIASLFASSDMLGNVREHAAEDPWGMLRAAVCLLPFFLLPIALLAPRTRKYLVWCTLLVAVLTLLDVTYGGRDPDEALHLRMAWFMGEGLLPYVDFFTVRNLLWHILCLPLAQLMEGDMRILAVARTIELLITLGTFALLVPVCRAAGGHPAIPLLATAIPFYPWGAVEFRADPPMTMLLVGSLWALAAGRPALAGLLSGLGYLMLQKAAFHGLAIGAGILLGGLGWRALLRYGGSAAIVSLLPFAIAYSTRIGDSYFAQAYRSSSAFAAHHQQTPFFDSMAFLVFGNELKAFPVLFLAALLGSVAWWCSGLPYRRMLAVCLMVDIALIFATKMAFKNYLLFPIMLLVLAAAAGYQAAQDARWPGSIEGGLPVAIVLISLTLGAVRWSAFPPTTIDTRESELILRLLPRGETFYGDSIRANMANPIFRFQVPGAVDGDNPAHYASWGAPHSLDPIMSQPPGVVVLDRQRAAELLARMKRERAVEYREVAPDIYLRGDLDRSGATNP